MSESMMAVKYGVYSTCWTGDDTHKIAEAALAAKQPPKATFPMALAVCVRELKERPESWFMIGCKGVMGIGDKAFDELIEYAKAHGLHVVKDDAVRAYRFSSCERDNWLVRSMFQCRA